MVPATDHSEMLSKGAHQSRAKLRALPVPSVVLLLGVTASIGIGRLLRFARCGALSEDFDSNAILLAHQVSSTIITGPYVMAPGTNVQQVYWL